MRRIALKWAVVAGIAVAALAALVGGRALHVWGAKQVEATSSTTCTSCITLSAPASPVLYPGAPPSSIPVTFTNVTDGPVYVTSLAVTLTNTFKPGCTASEFQLGSQAFSDTNATATLNFSPAQTIPAGGSWTEPATLAMPDNHTNQNACQGQALSLSYQGTANYTVMTTTSLTEVSNASTDTATLSATVGPDIQPAAAAHTPGIGDGSVTFYSCTSDTSAASCTTQLASASLDASGTAMISIPAGTVGSYNLEAVYAPSDPTNFVASTSPIVTETLSGCVSTQTAGATRILGPGQSYTGNYTIGSGSSLWLDGGTITGSVTVASGGQFAATGGSVNGNVQSSGGPIALSGATVTGNVQTSGGGLSLGPSTTVKGNVQAAGGGPFCSQGSSPTKGQVQVRGNLTVQNLTSPTTSSVSSTVVGNNLQWQYDASPGAIGVSGANTILGNLIVQYNAGNVTVGAAGSGNATSGNIIVGSNTGGGTLSGNGAGGNCLLSGDRPGIVGSSNTAKGQNQCNTGAGGA